MTEPFDIEAFKRDVDARLDEILARLDAQNGDRGYYTADTLAALLALSPRTVRQMLKDGVISSFKAGGRRLVDPVEVDRYVEARKAAADDA